MDIKTQSNIKFESFLPNNRQKLKPFADAIRAIHIPTGMIAESADKHSLNANKMEALRLLLIKLEVTK